MKLLLSTLLISFAFTSNAGELQPYKIPYDLVSSEFDSLIPAFESIYEFQFAGVADSNFTILYSIDGENGQADLTAESRLTLCAKPGKHIFQFFTWRHEEIFTDSIEIKSQYRDYYKVTMKFTQVIRVMAKPVIYLYPQEKTAVKVSLDIVGKNPFFYPRSNGSWEGMASPNGEIVINDATYNYLFWEADAMATTLLHREGFIVSKNEVVAFLEKQLSAAGLSSKEQADFITYWGPQMVQNEHNFVQFMFNDACDEFAELKISPKPDHVYRIYMLWQPTNTQFEVKEQLIEPMNRDGFSVLEWGGMELPSFERNESL